MTYLERRWLTVRMSCQMPRQHLQAKTEPSQAASARCKCLCFSQLPQSSGITRTNGSLWPYQPVPTTLLSCRMVIPRNCPGDWMLSLGCLHLALDFFCLGAVWKAAPKIPRAIIAGLLLIQGKNLTSHGC